MIQTDISYLAERLTASALRRILPTEIGERDGFPANINKDLLSRDGRLKIKIVEEGVYQ